MIFKDYYRILELGNSKATLEQIKTSYRELAKKYHPDKNVNNKSAEERFKDINEAYRVLSNPMDRKKYDKMWNTHVGNKKRVTSNYEESKRDENSSVSEFFNVFFGEKEKEQPIKKKKNPIKGDNIETEIEVTMEEAFYGKDKKISLRTITGDLRTFNIKIPAGIRNGEKIRLIGQGKSGENGGRNGDLFIKINIQNNKKFKLKGYDIYTDLLITPWEAALGTKVDIKGIDEKIKLYIPEGTSSGEQITIEQKGYKDGKGSRGNLIVQVKMMIPNTLTLEERKLFEKLNTISKFNPRNMLT